MEERIAVRAGRSVDGRPMPKGLLELRRFIDANCLRAQQVAAGEVSEEVVGVELIPSDDPVLKQSLVLYRRHFSFLTEQGVARQTAHEQAVAKVGFGDGFCEL